MGQCNNNDVRKQLKVGHNCRMRYQTFTRGLITLRISMQEIVEQTVEVGDCLEWAGQYTDGGPAITIYRHMTKARFSVPRIVWALSRGPAPAGQYIYRTCLNPRCVNKKHLDVGSVGSVSALRGSLGLAGVSPLSAAKASATKRLASKYTDDQVSRVRELLAAGELQAEISRQTGVSVSMVSAINRGVRRRAGGLAERGASVFSWRP